MRSLSAECRLDALLKLRREINAAAPCVDGAPLYKLSINDMVIKAWALALRDVPMANVSWTDQAMLCHAHADIGVAIVGSRRPHHHHPPGRDEDALRHLERDEGSGPAGQDAQAQARGLQWRQLGDLEPRHVRREGLRRDRQPAACHHPGGGQRRGAPRSWTTVPSPAQP